MKGVFTTRGICSQQIEIEVDDETHIIRSVLFIGGCHGNTQGISMLVKGMKAEDVIEKLQGIRCGSKPTSCPDQLTRALSACLKRIAENA